MLQQNAEMLAPHALPTIPTIIAAGKESAGAKLSNFMSRITLTVSLEDVSCARLLTDGRLWLYCRRLLSSAAIISFSISFQRNNIRLPADGVRIASAAEPRSGLWFRKSVAGFMMKPPYRKFSRAATFPRLRFNQEDSSPRA